MTDPDLVAKKLAEIETRLRELRSADLEKLHHDLREERFVLLTLQLAIQAAIDAASHVVADERLGEPTSYADLFRRLGTGGWIDVSLADRLGAMARFRDLLVHGYAAVDLDRVVRIVRDHLGDLERFVTVVRNRLPES